MKQKYLFIRIIILGLFFISSNSFAQKTVIRILDEQTSEPCPFANVVIYDQNNNYLRGTVSNDNGDVTFEITEKTKIVISYVGYETFTGHITPGEKRTIHLKPSFLEMEEVVVTGQFQPRKADQSIYKIDVINSKTILERGVTNLGEALSNETSIRLSGDESTGKSIVLQGLGGENVKYLIDGVPIVGRVRGNIDLSQINMENVDHIEIVQGPMSVVYGTSALAGVINIITKQNTRDKNIVKVNSYTDNKNHYNLGLYSSIIRGKHSLTLSGNRDMFQGIDINLNPADTIKHILNAFGPGKDRYMEFKPKKVLNAEMEYAFRDEDFQIRVKSQFMSLLLKQYSNPTPNGLATDFDYNTTRSTSNISISDKITNSLSYNIIGAYTYFGRTADEIISNLETLEKEKTGSSNTVFQNGMTRGNFTYAKEEAVLSYQFGWDINYDIGEGDKIAEDAEMGNFAGFLSAQYVPFEKLSIQPGLRYIYNTVYNAPLIPSINLQWTIINGLNFRVSYAKGFRAPSLKELYLDFKDSNHNLEGNKDLKAEKTDSYNASITYKYGKSKQVFKIEPSVFYNDGKDAITLIVTDIESNSATNTNLGGRRTRGGSFNASYMHFGGLSLGAGISRTGGNYDYSGEGSYTPIVYYNNYTLNAKYNFRKYKTVLMANLKYYDTTPSLAVDEDTEEYYQVYTEGHGGLEVTISKILWQNRLTLIVGGKNLLDNYSRRTYGYRGNTYEYFSPMHYGRTFFIKLNLKLYN